MKGTGNWGFENNPPLNPLPPFHEEGKERTEEKFKVLIFYYFPLTAQRERDIEG